MLMDFSNKNLYNAKYLPIFKNTKRYVFLMGGGGSGKSKAEAQCEVIASYKKGNRLLGVRKVGDTLRDSVFAEIVQVIDDWKLREHFSITTSPMRIVNNLTGSDMIFRGLDDVEKLKSVVGVTRIWFEEATEGDKKDFDQLDIRLRSKGKQLTLTCTYNPISDQHWLITDFWNYGTNENQLCIHSTYKDNRFIGHEEYERVFNRLKTQDPNLYNIYALGIPGKAVEGLVYSYENISSVPEEAKFLVYGLDFGFNHPACLVALYEWNGGIVIDEVFHKSGMVNEDYPKEFKENVIPQIETIVADNSRPEAIEYICRADYNCVPCKKGPDSVINGIMYIKGLKLYITARSAGVKKDFDNYVWAKDKHGNPMEIPVKAFDDGPDAVRYGLSHVYQFGEADEIVFVGSKKRKPEEDMEVKLPDADEDAMVLVR